MIIRTHRVILTVVLAVVAGRASAQTAGTPNKPIGTVEVGAGDVSQASFKAGEFNGLEKKGGLAIGTIDLRGNASYDSASALRWRFKSNDLGLDTRSAFGQIGVQGKFRLRVGYDGIRRNRSDTYQTPYLGTGTNVLTLPTSWLLPTVAGSGGANTVSARGLDAAIGASPYISTAAATNGALVNASASQISIVQAAAAADVPLFGHVNLHTTRSKVDASFNYLFNERWSLDASFRPESKTGMKPMGTVSRNTNADISTVIPDLIDTDTNQITLGLNFKGKKHFLQAGYYGSYFTNHVPSMSWQNWAAPAGVPNANTISSTPSNAFTQFSGTAGVNFSPTTKLVATGSYGRATQNVAFITDASTPVVPVSSLNGLVVSTAFGARLTARPAKSLNLSAAYKYDDRDNRTPINIYQFADANEPLLTTPNALFPAGVNNPLGAVIAQNANANRPYSRKLNTLTGAADFAFAKGQSLKGGYDFEKIDRSCPGAWIACADAATTKENTLHAEWRARAGTNLTTRFSYAYSARRTPDYNENAFLALVPYANVCPATSTGCVSALAFMTQNGWNGWGPASGFATTTGNMTLFFPSNNALNNAMYANVNRISELPGMRRYYVADRNRHKVRSLLGWQANDQLSIQGAVDLNRDNYLNSTYGLQYANGWTANLDGTYATDLVTFNVFYTRDHQRSSTAGNTYTANSNATAVNNGQPGVVGLSGNSCDTFTTLQQRNNNNKLDPCLNWAAGMLDTANTLGFGLNRKTEHFDLASTFTMSRQRWDNNVTGGSWVNNLLDGPGAAPTTVAAYFIPATPLPTVVTNSSELRVNGRYALAHGQSVRVSYAFLRMRSTDWMYDAMQFGTLSAQLPTLEQPFNYSVHVIGLSYVLTF